MRSVRDNFMYAGVYCLIAMAQKVSDLAMQDTGFGTAPDTDKADLIWEEAQLNWNETVTNFAKKVPASESYVRKVLKETSPTAFDQFKL